MGFPVWEVFLILFWNTACMACVSVKCVNDFKEKRDFKNPHFVLSLVEYDAIFLF